MVRPPGPADRQGGLGRPLAGGITDLMSEVLLDFKDHVAVITLNAPERRNALNAEMTRLLVEGVDEVDNNKDIGAAVIQGAGESFCAGADRRVLENRGQMPIPTAPDDPADG